MFAIKATIGGVLFSLAPVKYVCSVFDNAFEETIKISVKMNCVKREPMFAYAETKVQIKYNTIQILFIHSEIQNSITLAMNSYLPTYKLRQVYIHTSTTHIIS